MLGHQGLIVVFFSWRRCLCCDCEGSGSGDKEILEEWFERWRVWGGVWCENGMFVVLTV